MNMSERIARCVCGKLTATSRGEPVRISICHCLECKRRTGSAFAYNATFAAEQVETQGPFNSFTRSSDEGFWGRHHFCPECGAIVFYEIERRPGMITIPVGAFADPDFPEPTASVYDERRHSWLEVRTAEPLRLE
jgi:hypothetical protein